ncbi:MAG: DedA family protein [Hahellaceae bacterium]|nr:DedA family protein [Hahellaceae bacterium]
MVDLALLWGTAFLAATFVPFYSEVVLAKLVVDYPDWPWLLIGVASVGNTAGACVNWWMGRYLLHYSDRSWWPIKPKQLETAQRWFQRFGKWSLLFSWLPVGGDAITLLAGILRVRFAVFLALTFIGKALRFSFFVLLIEHVI